MRVILAEDSPLLRAGLVRLLEESGLDVLDAVSDAMSLRAAVAATPPDVVITDIRMPPTYGDEGLQAAVDIRAAHPTVGVLVLSQYLEAAYAERLLRSDASHVGYLLKDRVSDAAMLVLAAERVAAGGCVVDPDVVRMLVARPRADDPLGPLTDRERVVLSLMAEGWSNQGIADRMFLSPKTIEAHVTAILTKLDLRDTPTGNRRVLAVLRFLRGPAPADP
ncbi:MAG TPA: response regulator transcription factor [Nocardioidaceae bacterium]|nr:response regulator transcription factor [Nocardioidaceae bacterium]